MSKTGERSYLINIQIGDIPEEYHGDMEGAITDALVNFFELDACGINVVEIDTNQDGNEDFDNSKEDL